MQQREPLNSESTMSLWLPGAMLGGGVCIICSLGKSKNGSGWGGLAQGMRIGDPGVPGLHMAGSKERDEPRALSKVCLGTC